MAYILTLKNIVLEDVPESIGVAPQSWTGINIDNSVNRIGQKRKLTITVTSDSNIINTSIYINPGLFMPKAAINSMTGIPPAYYSVTLGNPYSIGIAVPCSYYAPGAPFPNQGKINAVFVRPLGPVAGKFDFEILIYFQQGYDVEGFINPNLDDNHSRFLKDRRSATSELSITGPSVYNDTSIDLRCYVYVQHVSASGHFGQIDINPKYGYKAGFYNKGTHGTAPYFTNPVFENKINSVLSSSFSTMIDADYTFYVNSPAIPVALVAKMIRTDKFDKTVEQEANYELDVADIRPAGSSTVKFKTPFTGPTLVAGSQYKWTFKIDKTALSLGQKYRIIFIVYYQSGPTHEVTSFISPEYDVTADVPYNGGAFTFNGKLGDLKTQYAGNDLTATIEERMFSRLIIDYSANAWKNDVFNRLGIVTTNDIRRYLTRIEFTIKSPFAIPPGWTGEFGEVYDYRDCQKTGATSYATKTGITPDFSTPDQLILFAEWRNRFEAAIANFASMVNGALTYPGGSSQYWGGLNLRVEWKLSFYYDDYITPFTDEIYFTQKLFVKDYVSDTVLKISAQNPPFDTKDFWCPGEDFCLQGEIVDPIVIDPALVYKLITNIDDVPGGITTILESEQWGTSPYISAQTNALIYAQETNFEDTVPLKALFCIDEEQLIVGNDYKVSVIAKQS